jgi:hypothetical protein
MGDVCVIGAGPSGLAASTELAARNIDFDCYEAGSGIGGVWRVGNDNGMSGIYDSLHTNISKKSMAFTSMPMPDHYPIFPHHSQVLSYLEEYARASALHGHITFRTRVTRVRPRPDGDWDVATRTRDEAVETTRRYGAVVIANGHHWDPRPPDPPVKGSEEFAGSMAHSHDYRAPTAYAGKRVLVVGMGNSACEIAAEISRSAAHTTISTRSGAHVFPKTLLGRPADRLAAGPLSDFPYFVKRPGLHLLLWLSRGTLAAYGLPKPDHRILAAHPSSSDELLVQLARGAITIKPGIAEYGRDHAVFTDGSRAHVDAVVHATGYKLSFPFLDPDLLDAANGTADLYLRTVPPAIRNLYFLGLAQPAGAAFPLFESQAGWIAELIDGTAVLPTPEHMESATRRARLRDDKKYSRSYRHGIEVDFRSFQRTLRRELRAGRRRRGTPVARRPTGRDTPAPVDAT